jgi:hypothetical protein
VIYCISAGEKKLKLALLKAGIDTGRH